MTTPGSRGRRVSRERRDQARERALGPGAGDALGLPSTTSKAKPYALLRVTAAKLRTHLGTRPTSTRCRAAACPRTLLTATGGGTAFKVTLTGEAEAPAGDPVGTGGGDDPRAPRTRASLLHHRRERHPLPAVGAHVLGPRRAPRGRSSFRSWRQRRPGSSRGCVAASRATVAGSSRARPTAQSTSTRPISRPGPSRGQLKARPRTRAELAVQLTGAEANNTGDPDGIGTATVRILRAAGVGLLPVDGAEHPPAHGQGASTAARPASTEALSSSSSLRGRLGRPPAAHRSRTDADRRDPREPGGVLRQRAYDGAQAARSGPSSADERGGAAGLPGRPVVRTGRRRPLRRRRGGRGRSPSARARAAFAAGTRAGGGTARRRPRSCPAPRRARPRVSRGRRGHRRSAPPGRCSSSRSVRSRPSSTSCSSSASRATGIVTAPWCRTSATSRTRRRIRFATRGVPRDRLEISSAAAGSISTPRIRALRRTIVASSSRS